MDPDSANLSEVPRRRLDHLTRTSKTLLAVRLPVTVRENGRLSVAIVVRLLMKIIARMTRCVLLMAHLIKTGMSGYWITVFAFLLLQVQTVRFQQRTTRPTFRHRAAPGPVPGHHCDDRAKPALFNRECRDASFDCISGDFLGLQLIRRPELQSMPVFCR